jgi:hypothetical protein
MASKKLNEVGLNSIQKGNDGRIGSYSDSIDDAPNHDHKHGHHSLKDHKVIGKMKGGYHILHRKDYDDYDDKHYHSHVVQHAKTKRVHVTIDSEEENGSGMHGDLATSSSGKGPKVQDVYHHLMKHGHVKGLSSDSQSPGAVKVWQRLNKKKGVNIHGWHPKEKKPVNLGKRFDPDETHNKTDHAENDHIQKTHRDKDIKAHQDDRNETRRMKLVAHMKEAARSRHGHSVYVRIHNKKTGEKTDMPLISQANKTRARARELVKLGHAEFGQDDEHKKVSYRVIDNRKYTKDFMAKRKAKLAKSYDADMKKNHPDLAEDAPVNAAGGGGIASIGQPPGSQFGEPGLSKGQQKKHQKLGMILRRKAPTGMFREKVTFKVPGSLFAEMRYQRMDRTWWKNTVGNDYIGEAIRDFANKNPDEPIILEDEHTGWIHYLRYGKSSW